MTVYWRIDTPIAAISGVPDHLRDHRTNRDRYCQFDHHNDWTERHRKVTLQDADGLIYSAPLGPAISASASTKLMIRRFP
jgi:hypothetical protein